VPLPELVLTLAVLISAALLDLGAAPEGVG
jgi:hypothetical protein